MRDFFINSLEKIINVIVVLGCVGVVIGTIAVAFAPDGGGIGPALAVLIGGAIYVLLFGGFMYLGLGIYHNTKRTAEAIETLNANARVERG